MREFGSTEHPTEWNKVPVDSTDIVLMCGTLKDKITEVFEIEDGSAEDTYQNLLIVKVSPRIQSSRSKSVFQLYGAAPHRSTRVRAYLNKKCYNYWISS